MRTKIITILISALIFAMVSVTVKAQIKVLSGGTVGIGSTIPAGYNASLYGRYFYLGTSAYYTNGMIKFDFGNMNPRIGSPSNAIVFYNSDVPNYIDIQVRTCFQYSDIKGKTNINSILPSNSLAIIKRLRGVTFNWKNNKTNLADAQANPGKLEYGFIAQEVDTVVPDLVITNDSTQGKMLNYTGIIPILVQAMKQQEDIIEAQSLKLKELESSVASINNSKTVLKSDKIIPDAPTIDNVTNAFLYQNIPNPFTYNTEIKFYLPESINAATIYIFDMQGLQIKNIPVFQRNSGSITLNGSELKPGMYIYTLICDGKEIDTKRMILTQ